MGPRRALRGPGGAGWSPGGATRPASTLRMRWLSPSAISTSPSPVTLESVGPVEVRPWPRGCRRPLYPFRPVPSAFAIAPSAHTWPHTLVGRGRRSGSHRPASARRRRRFSRARRGAAVAGRRLGAVPATVRSSRRAHAADACVPYVGDQEAAVGGQPTRRGRAARLGGRSTVTAEAEVPVPATVDDRPSGRPADPVVAVSAIRKPPSRKGAPPPGRRAGRGRRVRRRRCSEAAGAGDGGDRPLGETRRTRWFVVSARRKPPSAVAATSHGLLICAAVAGPPSPPKLFVPSPATVVMIPPAETLRIRWLFVRPAVAGEAAVACPREVQHAAVRAYLETCSPPCTATRKASPTSGSTSLGCESSTSSALSPLPVPELES